MAKKGATFRIGQTGHFTQVRGDIVRLSDPHVRTVVREQVRDLTKSKGVALKFLQDIGIATPTGRLTKRYGG